MKIITFLLFVVMTTSATAAPWPDLPDIAQARDCVASLSKIANVDTVPDVFVGTRDEIRPIAQVADPRAPGSEVFLAWGAGTIFVAKDAPWRTGNGDEDHPLAHGMTHYLQWKAGLPMKGKSAEGLAKFVARHFRVWCEQS